VNTIVRFMRGLPLETAVSTVLRMRPKVTRWRDKDEAISLWSLSIERIDEQEERRARSRNLKDHSWDDAVLRQVSMGDEENHLF